jgi:hypothetical protein
MPEAGHIIRDIPPGSRLDEMVDSLDSHNPQRCPQDTKTYLNLRTDGYEVNKGFHVVHRRRRYLRTVISAGIKLDTPADHDTRGDNVELYDIALISISGG